MLSEQEGKERKMGKAEEKLIKGSDAREPLSGIYQRDLAQRDRCPL